MNSVQSPNTLLIVLTSLITWSLTLSCNGTSSSSETGSGDTLKTEAGNTATNTVVKPPTTDTAAFNRLSAALANGDTTGRWPTKTVFPNPGAVLPFNRIIAFYGNLSSTRMGILGELPEDQMLEKLQGEMKKWAAADSSIPVIPALHYIASTAQVSPGREGNYTLRMPFAQIDTVLRMAKRIDALVFLDIQVGLSKIERELPMLEKYLKMPNVHLGIDPEFSMKTGKRPGTAVGSYDANDINFVINYLQNLVKANNLPPKVLVVHRYTKPMVKDAQNIQPVPEVQVVIHMDGWGTRERKLDSYINYIYREPVQFAGFKVFYKNDTKKVNAAQVMQPEEILKLTPKPVYIQYQ
jgi:hypothetical protein